MKILHTADIHLQGYQDERWQSLLELIRVGRQHQIDAFLICGDLFNQGINAEDLRPRIREVFSGNDFKVIIIPGNHDIDSFKRGMYFGEDVHILDKSPFIYEDVRITGLPFERIGGEELINKIRGLDEILTNDKKNILMCHGELLDTFFSGSDYGAEDTARYMPFKLSYFDNLNIDYVLAGHFHSRFNVRRLNNDGYFVYPGSPVSITRGEMGRRKVNIFEVGGPPQEYGLDTPHYEAFNLELNPFTGDNLFEIVRDSLAQLHPLARVIVNIGGYIDGSRLQMSETHIIDTIKEIVRGRCIEDNYDFRDISHILENDLFTGFCEKLADSGYSEEKNEQLQKMVIQAMMDTGL